ncbi:MAG: hypothetical protein ACP5PV_09840 [Methanothrix sp.]
MKAAGVLLQAGPKTRELQEEAETGSERRLRPRDPRMDGPLPLDSGEGQEQQEGKSYKKCAPGNCAMMDTE